ncbi:TRAP transporter small permease [Thalassospira sp. NFXS8]|uniref:TRAP transporter small permease n=1 Tax=Thalassospira TaxID=168934 RepID=UPI0003B6BE81|nr:MULTISPECIES: TRAP transporter small permease [Thalassospira]MBV16386.1 TRAP transporter small permease [Thalassospira sp.]RCK30389.1 transporter [Thalassospira lucentensis MCCC 1A00383 = DSM 14000]
MKLFLRVETAATQFALVCAIAFLLIAAGLAVYQVSTRFIFGHPSTWTEVITRFAMIWGVFMGVAPAIREGGMIAVDLVQRVLPRKFGVALYLVATALTIIFFAILFWQGWAMTGRVARQTVAGLDLSMSWAYAALPTASVFILMSALGSAIRAIQHGCVDHWEEAQ